MGVWKLIENEEERNAIGKDKISASLIRIFEYISVKLYIFFTK